MPAPPMPPAAAPMAAPVPGLPTAAPIAAPAAAPPTAPMSAPIPAPLAVSVVGSKPVCCLAHAMHSFISRDCCSAVCPFAGYAYTVGCVPAQPATAIPNAITINPANTRFISAPPCAAASRPCRRGSTAPHPSLLRRQPVAQRLDRDARPLHRPPPRPHDLLGPWRVAVAADRLHGDVDLHPVQGENFSRRRHLLRLLRRLRRVGNERSREVFGGHKIFFTSVLC